MKKTACFVEGQTEAIFIERIVRYFYEKRPYKIEIMKNFEKKRDGKIFKSMRVVGQEREDAYYVLIVDCGGESEVVSDFNDHFDAQFQAGFKNFVIVKDLRPRFQKCDEYKLRVGMEKGLKQSGEATTHVVLAIMEIEAWFLGENTHFTRRSASLCEPVVRSLIGYFPEPETCEDIPAPADDLSRVLNHAGLVYDKSERATRDEIDSLDIEYMNEKVAANVENLRILFNALANEI